MTIKYTEEFRRDAVRIAANSGLTRPKAASVLGAGLSALIQPLMPRGIYSHLVAATTGVL